MPRPDDLPPLDLPGGYQARRFLGRGAFGEVYEAEAPGRVAVAVKIIPRTLKAKEAKREEEALEIIRSLRHPFLLSLQAFYSLPDRLVIVLELAEGSLSQRQEACQRPGQPGIPRDELLSYFREAAEALDYLHQKNVQHRDVKPDNLLLMQGHVKVSDYGLARTLEKYTLETASSVGTPAFMAPEVWGGKVSPHSDQYSLAVSYLKLRLDRYPYQAENQMQLCYAHLHSAPDLGNPAELTEYERAALLKAMAKEPRDRYPSCSAFAAALASIPVGVPVAPVAGGSTKRRGVAVAKEVPETIVPPESPGAHTVSKSSDLEVTVGEEGGAAARRKQPRTASGKTVKATARRRKDDTTGAAKWGCGIAAAVGCCLLLGGLGLFGSKLFSGRSDTGPSTRNDTAFVLASGSARVPASQPGSGTALQGSTQAQPSETSRRPQTGTSKKETPVPQAPDAIDLDLGNHEKLVVKRIPAKGKTFWMGSPENEPNRSNEEVQHQVSFSRDYYLGVFKVTQGQFRAVMGKQDPPSYFSKNGQYAERVKNVETDVLPVENVSWEDAKKFCAELNRRFKDRGYQFSLPTEAQWEFACRAGDPSKESSPFYLKSGPSKSLSGGQVNFDGNYPYGDGAKGTYLQRTSRQDEFPESVNAFGLYDMHGNVWEWCEDYYSPRYYQDGVGHVTRDALCDQEDSENKNRRVVRGGSWLYYGRSCRSAFRVWYSADLRSDYVGFRVLLAPPQD